MACTKRRQAALTSIILLAWVSYFFLKLAQDNKAADHDHHIKQLISVQTEGAETKLKL